MERVTGADVRAAAGRLAAHLRVSPVHVIDGDGFGTSFDVVCKLDLLLPTGSFKVRGAMSLLTASDVPEAGVVAASGGNFGLAIAWAARRLGHRAEIFVPATSPAEKVEPIRDLGAAVHVVDGYYAQALEAARTHAAAGGALAAHAYDQPAVVAGQGTAMLELLDQAPDVDTVLVACGGGGLLAGTVAASEGRVRVVAVETEGTPTLHAARRAGMPVDVEVGGLAASALGAARLGDLAWAANDGIADAVLVTDADVLATQRRLWQAARLVAEPGGATALAALTSGMYRPEPGERVAVLVCGGNTHPGSVV